MNQSFSDALNGDRAITPVSMLTDYDAGLECLIRNLKPRWSELRIRARHFEKRGENSATIESFLLVGTPSLLCSVGSKSLGAPWRITYCPVVLELVDPNVFATPDWVTLAKLNGTSGWDAKLQFLFDEPKVELLTYQDTVYDGEEPNEVPVAFRFYAGIGFADHAQQHVLRAMASQLSDFVFHVDMTEMAKA